MIELTTELITATLYQAQSRKLFPSPDDDTCAAAEMQQLT
jgi:hypothetical protein